MDLSTTYLGLKLAHPLVPGASPLTGNLDTARRLEDAGAPALILHSLFEEQLLAHQIAALAPDALDPALLSEALKRFPTPEAYALNPAAFLEQLVRIKEAVRVPVIASLNGVTPGGWIDYAQHLEQAGADALELNLYFIATRPHEDAGAVEDRHEEIVRAVRGAVTIPLAVKLMPFYTALPSFAGRLAGAGADGLVLFSPFYAPDLDIEHRRRVAPSPLTTSSELPLRLYWLSALRGQAPLSLAASGGVHHFADAIRAVMAGADAVQMVSALMIHGPEYLRTTLQGMTHWLEEHGYDCLAQIRAAMSQDHEPHPLWEQRAAYIRLLQDSSLRPKPLQQANETGGTSSSAD